MVDEKLLKNAIRLLLEFLIQDSVTWNEEKWLKFEKITGMSRKTLSYWSCTDEQRTLRRNTSNAS